MIRLNQLKLPVNHTEEQLVHKTAQSLRIPTEDILELEVVRQSLDARKKPELFYSYSIDVINNSDEVKNATLALAGLPKSWSLSLIHI